MSTSVSVTARWISPRRLAAAALAAGAMVGVAALPASAAGMARPHGPLVEITAVQADSPGRDVRSDRSLNKEWVELTNSTRQSVNLDGWTLRDNVGRTYVFHHYRLGGRDTVRIHTGQGRDTRTDLYQDRRDHAWDNYRGTITLRDDRGRFVDDESWGRYRHHGDYRGHGDDRRHGDYRHHGDDYRHGDYRHHGDDYRHGDYRHHGDDHRHGDHRGHGNDRH
ncbi:lamin tail domain-containing protein [Streptomyces sp. NPDC059378]|uniref:lamin tail domain-containing protein n=1 Tax=Streptomyces sp. NPDC059378 TaxID=3346815 RepID=UPI0036811382